MSKKESIKIFEDREIRTLWDDEKEQWYFSIVDVVAVLTESPNPRKYWSVLKTRLKKEGSQLATNCSQLKMTSADVKKYRTDCVDTEQLFRLIQSIPSPKAEPFKLWMAQVARQGGEVARNARLELEAKTGKKVVSPLNAKDGILLGLPDNSQEENNNNE